MTLKPIEGERAPVTVVLRGLLPGLQPSLARVARYILQDPAGVAAMSITDLARRAETSETTVVRLCRRLGVDGYPRLRLLLAQEIGSKRTVEDYSGDIDPNDSLVDVVRKIAFADSKAVEETAQSVSMDALEAVVAAIVAAARVDVYGVGASGFVALDLQQKLLRVGFTAFAWSDVHFALTSAALLGPGDVAIGISHTGSTLDTIEPLELAGRRGATTVAITNGLDSPIAGSAELVLATAARETTFRSGAMSSRLAQLAMVDFVFVGVAQRRFDRSREAIAATAEAVRSRRVAARSGGRGDRRGAAT